MRVGLLVATLALLVGGGACGGGSPSRVAGADDAACAAPQTAVQPATVRPGQSIRVTASGLLSGCADHVEVMVDDDGRALRTHAETAAPLSLEPRHWHVTRLTVAPGADAPLVRPSGARGAPR